MAIGTATPRDKLDQLIAFARRSLRYWWLVGVITVVGGSLAALLAFHAKPKYMSEARLLYNEKISSSLVQGRDAVNRTRNLGDTYRELLMARPQLMKVITELGLQKEVLAQDGEDAALEEFKAQVKFRIRGTGMFHIQYICAEPDEAVAVTTMLTDILINEDRRLRQENARTTREFLEEQKAEFAAELAKRQGALYAFMAENPEFAQDNAQGPQAASGSGIRAAVEEGKDTDPLIRDKNTDPRLLALERQRRRIKGRLEAPDKDVRPPKTPEQREAEQEVRDAKRELASAERQLENIEAQFTAAHPDVRRAQKRVRDAQAKVVRAEAAVPPDPPKPAKIDRGELAKELGDVERQIAATRAKIRREKKDDGDAAGAKPEEEEPANWVVALENEFARLSLEVQEARRRVNSLDASLSKAEIEASQQMAEEGAVLTIIDPPNRPSKPQGKGPLFLTAAGIMAFFMLGAGLALALALVDDRIYTAGDLEGLDIAPVMVVIPGEPERKRFRRG